MRDVVGIASVVDMVYPGRDALRAFRREHGGHSEVDIVEERPLEERRAVRGIR